MGGSFVNEVDRSRSGDGVVGKSCCRMR